MKTLIAPRIVRKSTSPALTITRRRIVTAAMGQHDRDGAERQRQQPVRGDGRGDRRGHDGAARDHRREAHARPATSELVNATIAVSAAIAMAATRPPQPSGGRVIITTNVMMISSSTRP